MEGKYADEFALVENIFLPNNVESLEIGHNILETLTARVALKCRPYLMMSFCSS